MFKKHFIDIVFIREDNFLFYSVSLPHTLERQGNTSSIVILLF